MIRKIISVLIIVIIFALAGTGFAEDTEVRMFQIRSADPDSLQSIVSSLLTDQGTVSYDARTNNLIVVDTPTNLEKIADVIQKIDKKLTQVRIDVVIADVSEEFIKDIGLKFTRFIIPDGAKAVVSLIESRPDASIRSRSFVTTLDNHPARLEIAKDIILGFERIIYPDGISVYVPQTEPVGNILQVLPQVGEDNTITLYIQPTLSTLTECEQIPFNRTIATQVVVADGEGIVIGGLDVKGNASSRSSLLGVPASSSKSKEARKIVMFVTAEIVH